MSPESCSSTTSRFGNSPQREYMMGEGAIFITDISNQFMNEFAEEPPRVFQDENPHNYESLSPELAGSPAASLYCICKPLREHAKHIVNSRVGSAMASRYGASSEAISQADDQFKIDMGLASLDFTWHLAPVTASAIVKMFQEKGLISIDQYQNLGMTDMANVIGSGWFSNLMHTMAYTSFGRYRRIGDHPVSPLAHYDKAAFQAAIHSEFDITDNATELFEPDVAYEPYEDRTYLTATPSAPFKKALRAKMLPLGQTKQKDSSPSPGCPAARYVTELTTEFVDNDPQAQRLLQNGTFKKDEELSDSKKMVLRQEYTAIDVALRILADKIDAYYELFGTPRMKQVPDRVYRVRPTSKYLTRATNVLRLPGEIDGLESYKQVLYLTNMAI